MTTVLLSWSDPEDASEFLRLRAELRRGGLFADPSRDELARVVAVSEVERDG